MTLPEMGGEKKKIKEWIKAAMTGLSRGKVSSSCKRKESSWAGEKKRNSEMAELRKMIRPGNCRQKEIEC